MQATKKKGKGELILENRGKLVTVTVKEISQTGITLEYNSQDQWTGKVNGRGNSTTTVRLKTDNTAEWESKGVAATNEGDFIAVWGSGTGKNTSPTTQTWEGELHFMGQSPKLSWLNTTTGWVEGTGDQVKGESHVKVFQKK